MDERPLGSKPVCRKKIIVLWRGSGTGGVAVENEKTNLNKKPKDLI
jgi:hypothetical protein